MRWIRWAVVCLLATVGAAEAQSPDRVLGDWHGALNTPQGELVLLIGVTRTESGELSAELEVPAQAPGRKIPIREFTVVGDSLTFTIPSIGASYRAAWDDAAKQWTGVFTQGLSLPLTLERGSPPAAPVIEGLDGTWNGTLRRNDVDLRLVLRVRTDANGTIATLDSPDMNAMGLRLSEFTRRGERISFGVPAAAVQYTAQLSDGGGRMTGAWTRPGQPDASVSFVRTQATTERAPRQRPQQPKPPFDYEAEDVTFPNPDAADVTLAGTLTLPRGEGPFPAAVLISGSGPQDRDETILGHKPFAVLADHLTRRGIAVLRYDDRGVGESDGDFGGATSADFATDANAAFHYLHTRADIDRNAIGFIGHSEGGMVAPIAAASNDHIAFIVLLAGPGTSTTQLMESQRRLLGLSQGASEEDLDRAAPVVAGIHAAVTAAADRADAERRVRALLTPQAITAMGLTEAQRELAVQQFAGDWYRYFLTYDPARFLTKLTMPVLALNGSLDLQVPADENLAGITRALARNPDVTVRKIDGLNHLFQTARSGAIGEYADIEETFSPLAMELVADWILARFGGSGSS